MNAQSAPDDQAVDSALDQSLAAAMAHQAAGRMEAARAAYSEVLLRNVAHPQANHNLGILLIQAGQVVEGVELFRRALEARPNEGSFWISYIKGLIAMGRSDLAAQALQHGMNQGLRGSAVDELQQTLRNMPIGVSDPNAQAASLLQAGNFAAAAALSRSILAQDPTNESGWSILVGALRALGSTEEALTAANAAILALPESAVARCNLASLLQQGKQFAEAEAAYLEAIRLNPDLAEAHCFLGQMLFQRGVHDTAAEHAQRALRINPKFADALVLLGAIQSAGGDLASAKNLLLQALSIQPANPYAHFNLGLACMSTHEWDEAEQAFSTAVHFRPNYAEALSQWAQVLVQRGRFEEGESKAQRALAIDPNLVDGILAHALALGGNGRTEEALKACRRALSIDPGNAQIYATLGRIHTQRGEEEASLQAYQRALELNPEDAQLRAILLFRQAKSGAVSGPSYLSLARSWELESLPQAARAAAQSRVFSNSPRNGRRLRVGWLSGDLRQHAVSSFLCELLPNMDRSRVENIALSTCLYEDDMTQRLRPMFDQWVDISRQSDAEARDRIQEMGVDVLLDLSGHTAFSRMAMVALRAAPVQAHYLGFFASTGISQMDYWIADPVLVPPESDSDFSETVWRLPRTWISYAGRDQAPDVQERDATDGSLWLGSFNNVGKLSQNTVALWARIMNQLPHARLALKAKALETPESAERLLQGFERLGVQRSRLRLLARTPSWREHMEQYGQIDIALDPVGAVGGGTTTCDALWMGVPVITLAGNHMAQRMSASMLAALGRHEWIAQTEDDYVGKVMTLANDPLARKAMRGSQREQMRASSLCDAAGLGAALVAAFESMYDQWWNHR